MRSGPYVAGLLASVMLLPAACGSWDGENAEADDTNAFAEESGTNLSDLPADFPRELIPEQYTTLYYTDMKHINGTVGASFESFEPVEPTIQHYMALLGEPTINVDSDDGERNVQWHKTRWPGWIVGVLGNDGETIVSVTKVPAQ